MKWMIFLLMSLLLGGCCVMPDSAGSLQPVAFVAKVPRENVEAVRELCIGMDVKDGRVGGYLREIEEESYLFVYSEDADFCETLEICLGPGLACEPLPVAKWNDRVLEPMERLFYEAGAAGLEPEGEVMRIAMFTGLKSEKEKDYRLLHDNPWPDVITAIRRANFRHFSIFLEEINGRLYLFGWLEYVGADLAIDDAINKKDPASIRWWKETDACQFAPSDAGDGMWGGLEELFFVE